MAENFPNLKKETDIQIQEAWRVPNKMNPKRLTSRHVITKMTIFQGKERFLNAERGKKKVLLSFGRPIHAKCTAESPWQVVLCVFL